MLFSLGNILVYLFLRLKLKLLVCLNLFIPTCGHRPLLALVVLNITLFLDAFPHFLWVFPLRAKSNVFLTFSNFHACVKTQFKHDIQLFVCDKGRAFSIINHRFIFRFQLFTV